MPAADPPRVAAIIPVGTAEGAKTRLGETLDAEERHELVDGFLARTVVTALAVTRFADVLVVSPDRELLLRATELGARTLRQRSRGLRAGLADARADVVAGGAIAIVVLPIDLPFVSVEAVDAVVDALLARSPARPSCSSPTAMAPAPTRWPSGHPTSSSSPSARGAAPPIASARRRPGRAMSSSAVPLTVDLDTPEDLVFVESAAAERLGVR